MGQQIYYRYSCSYEISANVTDTNNVVSNKDSSSNENIG